MQEEIEIQKQLESLRDRVKFLREWVGKLKNREYYINDDAMFRALNALYEAEALLKHRQAEKDYKDGTKAADTDVDKSLSLQVEALKEKVIFLRGWADKLREMDDITKQDKIYDLENEANHKEYMIKMRENDMKMYEQQRQQITKQVNDEFGGLIKELRTKIFPSTKDTTIADGIIKRFSKNDYASNEAKVQDFVMAKQLLK